MSVGLGSDRTKPWELTGERPAEFEARKLREQFYRKSQYPPMAIEPLPNKRSRVLKMTEEDRLRRMRWVKDQVVHPEDIQEIPRPKNLFRRIYNKPLDAVFNVLRPIMGKKTGSFRKVTGHFLAAWAGLSILYYDSVYSCKPEKLWESRYGPDIRTRRERVFGEAAKNFKHKEPQEYASRGFHQRTALKDMKTSFNSPLSS